MVDEPRQHVERARIGRIEHIRRRLRGIRKFHGFGRRLFAQRVDARLLHDPDGFAELLGVLEETTPKNKYAIGSRPVRQIARWNIARVVRRKHQVFGAFALVWPGQADIAAPLASFDHPFRADGPLEEIVKDALQARRHLDHHRAVLFQVQIAHGINHVRVRRGDKRLGVEPVFPDRQHVVTRAENALGTLFHGVHVQRRQRP
ncbi:hypothetical protein D3C71_1513960 [compost metagenome]